MKHYVVSWSIDILEENGECITPQKAAMQARKMFEDAMLGETSMATILEVQEKGSDTITAVDTIDGDSWGYNLLQK